MITIPRYKPAFPRMTEDSEMTVGRILSDTLVGAETIMTEVGETWVVTQAHQILHFIGNTDIVAQGMRGHALPEKKVTAYAYPVEHSLAFLYSAYPGDRADLEALKSQLTPGGVPLVPRSPARTAAAPRTTSLTSQWLG